LADLFEKCIRGCDDPDLPGELSHLGLELRGTHEKKNGEEPRENPPVWIGAQCKGSSSTLAAVLDGGPAAAAGLSPADEVIAVNGYKISGESGLRKRLAACAPGQGIEVAMFRRGRLQECTLVPGEAPPSRYEIVGVDEPSDAQRERFGDWLGSDHPGSGTIAGAAVKRVL
jgi:predicted metalloprotease with PDZ domain